MTNTGRLLQLLDATRHENMINFRDFAWSMGVMCRGDVTHRLKLIYCLHLSVDPDTPTHTPSSPLSGGCKHPHTLPPAPSQVVQTPPHTPTNPLSGDANTHTHSHQPPQVGANTPHTHLPAPSQESANTPHTLSSSSLLGGCKPPTLTNSLSGGAKTSHTLQPAPLGRVQTPPKHSPTPSWVGANTPHTLQPAPRESANTPHTLPPAASQLGQWVHVTAKRH